jgi:predicted small lipoprotein YifL
MLIGISACGQTGPLYLPPTNNTNAQKVSPASAIPTKTQENSEQTLKPKPSENQEKIPYINPISQPVQP